jgi:hypothetical protein
MAEMDFSKQSAGPVTTTTFAPPPTFTANMMRDAAIGALISIGIGFGLLFVQMGLFPSLNLNRWMISTIGNLAGSNGVYVEALLGVPLSTDSLTPFYVLQYVYAAFISFPSNIAWFFGGLIVGALRIRSGRDEGNLKAGWDTFWYAMLSIEIPFAIFGVIFLITVLIPGAFTIAAFAGSLLLYFLLFFLMPMFWLGLIFALLGSAVGSAVAKKKT